MKQVICTSYGSAEAEKGLVIITEKDDQYRCETIPLPGKCSFCIEHDNRLYVPVQAEQPVVMEYRRNGAELIHTGTYSVSHFYAHGVFYKGYLFLASFSDGADAVYDISTHKELDFFNHFRNGYSVTGRSHYIGVTPDQNYLYAVDNALQVIYVYEIRNNRFCLRSTVLFPDENIRLMPVSEYSGCAYLNTEITNRIYVMRYDSGEFHIQDTATMEVGDKCFSGGCAVSEDGRHLCVSLRGDDFLEYYRIHKDGSLTLLNRVSCGAIPRDIRFVNEMVYVSCTGDNSVEVYSTKGDILRRIQSITIPQPVTFAVQEKF